MSDPMPQEQTTVLTTAADHFITRVREWWQRHGELRNLDRTELDRIAGEFGMNARDLQDLAAGGPHAAGLLYQRMQALGVTRADVERLAHGLMTSAASEQTDTPTRITIPSTRV